MVFGEITTEAPLDYEKIVRNEVKKIGFDSFVDDLASVDSKGLSCDSCEVIQHTHSPFRTTLLFHPFSSQHTHLKPPCEPC